jgi:hypothetical protein
MKMPNRLNVAVVTRIKDALRDLIIEIIKRYIQ